MGIRKVNGHWVCLRCGQSLDIAADKQPAIVFKTGNGSQSERAIVVDGKEVHVCRPAFAN
jgi:hypothetical protein